ncbi:MAG: ADOP family duplicated permease [Vicinamibacterales bacterium]
MSVRQLIKTPGFTVAAVVVLSLGIGLNAAMFSLVYAFGFMGRPYAEPERLVQLYSSQTTKVDSFRAFSYAAYRELADQPGLFAGVLAHTPTMVGLSEGGQSRRSMAVLASRNYFDVLGVPVIRGRGFTADEDRVGQDIPVTVATYAYWQRTGFKPDLVGSTIRVNERAYTVVGITPRGFTGTMMIAGPELFFPLGVFHTLSDALDGDGRRALTRDDVFNLFLVARLERGVTLDSATTRVNDLGPQLTRRFPAEYEDARVSVAPLPRFGTTVAPRDEGVLAVLGAVLLGLTGAVLLVVCLNLAAMLMARGRARRKEFAIRLALGGGRGRIIRQLLTEGFLLAVFGGVGGVALGLFATTSLVSALSAALPISFVLEGVLSPALVIATLLFCGLATTWFALAPALRYSRADVMTDLKPQAGEDVYERRRRFVPRNPLQVAQVALSISLLIAAGMFVRMVLGALSVDFGFRADDTVVAEVDSRLGGYSSSQSLALYADLERRLAALPGVESASIAAIVPLGMSEISQPVRRAGIHVPDDARPLRPEDGQSFNVPWNAVSGGYFNGMGVTLREGRTFTEAEAYGPVGRRVAIIDETLAHRLWPDGRALGQQVEIVERGPLAGRPAVAYDVVGIVGSTRRQLFEDELRGSIYVPFAQGALSNAHFHVRPRPTQAGSPGLTDAVRQEIHAAAPGLPLFSARTFAAHMSSAPEYWTLRITGGLFAAFGALAMLVALVGIYAVMSYAVARRTREIGIRMAVGAVPAAVKRMIMVEGLTLTLMGVGLGLLLGAGVGRVMGSMFVDLPDFDPVTFTVVPIAFVAAAGIAAWLPARRATRVNPVTALRSE